MTSNFLSDLQTGRITSAKDLYALYPGHEAAREAQFAQMCAMLLPPVSQNAQTTDNRLAVYLGGGPASGKSTFKHTIRQYCEQHHIPAAFISNEDIRSFFPEVALLRDAQTNPMLSRGDKEFFKNVRGFFEHDIYKYRARLLEEAAKRGIVVVLEGHFFNGEKTAEAVNLMRGHGYQTLLIAPDISMETYRRRASRREIDSGKPFVDVKGFDHHMAFEKNWLDYTKLFDCAVRFDNDRENEPPRPFAISLRGNLYIIDEARYEQARRKQIAQQPGKGETVSTDAKAGHVAYQFTEAEMGRCHQGDIDRLLRGLNPVLGNIVGGFSL